MNSYSSMRKQNNYSPGPQCNCQCNRNQNDSPQINRSFGLRDSHSTIRGDGCMCKCAEQHSFPSNSHYNDPVDERTRQKVLTMRQKACRFITSQTDYSSGSDSCCRPPTCQNMNNERQGSLIQQAKNSIDYVPESEFLRKFSGQCDCRCSNQSKGRKSPSKVNDNQNIVPRVCQECIVKSTEIIKLLELLHNQGLMAANQMNNQTCGSCQCGTEEDVENSGFNRIVKTCRSVVDDLKNVLTNMGPCCVEHGQDDNTTCKEEMQNAEESFYTNDSNVGKYNSRSQHVSRSKKRVKCRGRRKRKSIGSEKCNSQDNFEPSLKKPYEISCERCWRYASPSRSPVNKPAQRFDPNFRRAHSCQDLISNETERDNGENVEVFDGRPASGGLQSHINQNPSRLFGLDNAINTKRNELIPQCREPRTPPSRYPRDRTFETERYISADHSDRKSRPKSCTPGASSTGRGNYSSPFDNLDTTEYKEIAFKKTYSPTDWNVKGPRMDASPANFRNKSYLNNQSRNIRNESEGFNSMGSSPKDCIPRPGSLRNEESTQNSFRGYRERPKSGRNAGLTSPSKPISECRCNKSWSIRSADQSNINNNNSSNNRNEFRYETNSPVRAQSSEFQRARSQSPCDRRPNTASNYDVKRLPSGVFRSQSPRTENTSQTRGDREEKRCCTCQSPVSKPKRDAFLSDSNNNNKGSCKSRCCHCKKNKNPSEPACSYGRSSPLKNPTAYPAQPLADINENCFSGKENSQSYKSTPGRPESQGKRAPCPHRANANDANLSGRSFVENQKNFMRGRESFAAPVDRRTHPNSSIGLNQSTPKKYCVFYMTNNKNDRGNEVELLVEEVTEGCRNSDNDSRMSDLKEKVKRLDDRPLESMALRFQKGVTESAKNVRPESSRILYF